MPITMHRTVICPDSDLYYIYRSLVQIRVFLAKIVIISNSLNYMSACFFGDQMSRLVVTVLLSTSNICFGIEITKKIDRAI